MLIIVYLAAIVAANLSIAAFGPSAAIVNAFLFIGLDFTARDRLHDLWAGRHLWARMAALIAAGSLLSYAINRSAGPIALASFVAFAVAGAVDALIYHLLRGRSWAVRVNGSNVASSAADSLIFPALAFGGLLWPIVLGQFAAKIAGGLVWSAVLKRR